MLESRSFIPTRREGFTKNTPRSSECNEPPDDDPSANEREMFGSLLLSPWTSRGRGLETVYASVYEEEELVGRTDR